MSGKKVLIVLAVGQLANIDRVAKAEHRTRSELIREALRRYVDDYDYRRAVIKGVESETRTNPKDR